MSKRKVVLVTGSTSGIGLGIAKEFASNGYDIGLNGLGDAAVVETIKRDIEVNFGAQVFYSDAERASGFHGALGGQASHIEVELSS